MAQRNFNDLLAEQFDKNKFLCVGLDPDLEKMPENIRTLNVGESILTFNRAIIDATADVAGSYKPNSAFYEAHGEEGWRALRETILYIQQKAPDVPVILDAKRGDIGNTNNGYVRAAFDDLKADAITVHPYLGGEALTPFLEQKNKGIFVLCRTSNPGAGELQDFFVEDEPLYMHVARTISEKWNENGNCGLVVGATYPEELQKIRTEVLMLPILIPGTGTQGGDLQKSVSYGKDSNGKGFILAIGRAIIYAADVRKSAQEFDRAIRAALVE